MDQSLKQRLIGAVIIVSLIVIFVPMLFDEAPENDPGAIDGVPPLPQAVEEKSLNLPGSAAELAPPPPSQPANAESGYKIIPLDDAPRSATNDVAPAQQANQQIPSADASSVEEEVWEPVGEAPVAAAANGTAEPGATADNGAPAVPAPAAVAKDRPKDAGKRDKNPVEKKPAAVAAAETPPKAAKAPAAQKSESTEKRNAAAKSPAAKGAAAPPGAWVVQAGSFTGEGNAKLLVDRLRKAKFPAFVETVHGSNSTMFRVHVGPELSRARAEQMLKQIESTVGVKGILLSHD